MKVSHWLQSILFMILSIFSIEGYSHAGDQRSIEELNALLAENPGEPSLLVARGSLHARSGHWQKAEQDLKLAETFGDKYDVAFEMGRLYYYMGDFQTALGYLDKYISVNSKYPEAFLLRARAASEAKRFDIAIASYKVYLDTSPQPHPGEYLTAAKLLVEIRPDGINSALAILDEGIKKLGLNPQLQRYAMELELRRGEGEDALERWYSLEDQLGHSPEWTVTLGDLLIQASKFDKARLATIKAKAQLVSLRPTPARKTLHEVLARLEIQIDEYWNRRKVPE
ncbi:MAG: hypothetical protein CMQ19_14460 [Gammaproteobacteria bacterium]|nr:hypothetical protein [Gammaproteobacteria bacterium]